MHRIAPGIWCQTALTPPPKKKPLASHPSVSLCCLTCRLSRVSCPRLCFHIQPHQSQAPRLPDSDRHKIEFFRFLHRCGCETRTKESNMNASFSAVSRETDQGVYPSGKEESCGSPVKAQASARVDVPTAPFSFAVWTKQSTTCFQVLCECLGMCTTGNRPWS